MLNALARWADKDRDKLETCIAHSSSVDLEFVVMQVLQRLMKVLRDANSQEIAGSLHAMGKLQMFPGECRLLF